ncbi:hypothetical protein MHYP_G00073880 [Metynnis hypsauchen]
MFSFTSALWLPLERSASSSNNCPPILFMLLSLIENKTPPQKPASSHAKLFLVCCFSAEAPVPNHARPLHFGGGPVSDYFVSDPVEDVEDEEGQREGRSGDGVDSLRSVHELPPVVLGVLQDGRLLDGISRGAFHRRTVFHAWSHAVAGEMETSLPQLLLLDIHRKKEEASFIRDGTRKETNNRKNTPMPQASGHAVLMKTLAWLMCSVVPETFLKPVGVRKFLASHQLKLFHLFNHPEESPRTA